MNYLLNPHAMFLGLFVNGLTTVFPLFVRPFSQFGNSLIMAAIATHQKVYNYLQDPSSWLGPISIVTIRGFKVSIF